ncbi:MAG: hypothetical protein JWR45_3562 [Blastococcus sp.]|jgi:hypothetical protein|nr:hypothetical protein [Blastococcus sp.]
MRRTHAATALVVLSAGLTASAALRRSLAHRRHTTSSISSTTSSTSSVLGTATATVPDVEAVVLPFARRVVPVTVPGRPAAPARCGDGGGRTKAGAPCGLRATSGGRCHHHPVAA